METTRFLITGVGGQGTILASDMLAEIGLRPGYDAKKSDILGLAVRGDSVVSHIIWDDKIRGPMIDHSEYPDVEGIRDVMRGRCAALHVVPSTPMAVDMGNARVFNSTIMGRLSLLAGGDEDIWRSAVADTVAQSTQSERQGVRRRTFLWL